MKLTNYKLEDLIKLTRGVSVVGGISECLLL